KACHIELSRNVRQAFCVQVFDQAQTDTITCRTSKFQGRFVRDRWAKGILDFASGNLCRGEI
ncbi:MAG: hypothetical protein R6V77_00320, partial [Candidatus Cloacimonadaceae bacterium]